MSGRWEIPIVCWMLSALRLAASLAATGEEFRVPQQAEFNARFRWLITLVLASGACNDILIALSMSYFLSRGRSGIKRFVIQVEVGRAFEIAKIFL